MHMPSVELHLMYGLTECKRVSILSAHELQTRGESVGKPLPGTHVSLEPIPGEPPERGILIVTGPHVALGYLRADSGPFFRREGESFRSLRTGDVVSLDADGYIYFQYRRNLLIKHRGFRINPIEIESVLRSQFDVQTCLVKHEQGDLILFVEAGADKKAIQAALLEQVDGYKQPDRIVAISSFPQTGNGKLDRRLLSQWEVP